MFNEPLIIARGTDNIVTSIPTSNDEALVLKIKKDVEELYGASRVIEVRELPRFYPPFYDAINLKVGFEKEESVTKCFVFDIEKAKEILKDMMRTARQPLLEALDTQYIIALERHDASKINKIALKKQQLRDVTSIDLPNDFIQIQKTWPEILGPHPFKIEA